MALMHNLKLFRNLISLVCIALFAPFFVFAVDYSLPPVDVSVSAIVDEDIIITSGGGGGFITSVVFSGYAYPGATVYIWKNTIPRTTTIADERGYFTATLNEEYNPNVLYTLYAVDKDGRKSIILNYPLVVKKGYVTQVSGIKFAPTIAVDKIEAKEGSDITVSGYAIPEADIDITIDGSQYKIFRVTSNDDGTYRITIPITGLKKGEYSLYDNYKNDRRISKVLKFTISDINILSTELVTNIPGDCNADQTINLVDFSIAAFWYGKPNPPRCVDTNKDNVINLTDFSILAFYWNG